MKLRPEEITSILRQRIEEFDVETNLAEVGAVLQLGDGIARVHGLENCVALEMLELEHGVVGLAFNLEEDNVGAALFGEWDKVSEGEPVRRTGKVASVPVGEALLGRVVDPLGNPLDGQGPIEATETRPVEWKAPGVIQRQTVLEAVDTGDAVADLQHGADLGEVGLDVELLDPLFEDRRDLFRAKLHGFTNSLRASGRGEVVRAGRARSRRASSIRPGG